MACLGGGYANNLHPVSQASRTITHLPSLKLHLSVQTCRREYVYIKNGVSFVEWTQIITKYLWEQLQKVAEFYRQFPSQGCASPQPATPAEVETAMKQWEYNEKLAMFMFQVSSSKYEGWAIYCYYIDSVI